jgi:ribosomal protein S18 acetylase RimI-like enzyme
VECDLTLVRPAASTKAATNEALMPALESPATFAKLNRVAQHPSLAGFDCGDHRYDRGVNGLVRHLYRGHAVAEVMVMQHEGRTAGVAAWQRRPLITPEGPLGEGDAYVYVFGVARDCREQSEPDGRHLGSALMAGMLNQMQSEAPDGLMPASWAYIAPFNRKSHRLFAYHGYATRAPSKGHDIIRFRPSGLDPQAGGLYYRPSALELGATAG